jgi:small subunit ribosomal protein S6
MAEILNKYETIFVVNPDFDEEQTAEMVSKFKTLIEENGEVEDVDEWGKRRLAYEVMDFSEGYYVLINFSSVPDFPKELDRIYKITDGVIRHLIIKKDE